MSSKISVPVVNLVPNFCRNKALLSPSDVFLQVSHFLTSTVIYTYLPFSFRLYRPWSSFLTSIFPLFGLDILAWIFWLCSSKLTHTDQSSSPFVQAAGVCPWRGNLCEHQPPTQTFLGVRHVFPAHERLLNRVVKFLSYFWQISAAAHVQIIGEPIGTVEVKVLISQTHTCTYKLGRV